MISKNKIHWTIGYYPHAQWSGNQSRSKISTGKKLRFELKNQGVLLGIIHSKLTAERGSPLGEGNPFHIKQNLQLQSSSCVVHLEMVLIMWWYIYHFEFSHWWLPVMWASRITPWCEWWSFIHVYDWWFLLCVPPALQQPLNKGQQCSEGIAVIAVTQWAVNTSTIHINYVSLGLGLIN